MDQLKKKNTTASKKTVKGRRDKWKRLGKVSPEMELIFSGIKRLCVWFMKFSLENEDVYIEKAES